MKSVIIMVLLSLDSDIEKKSTADTPLLSLSISGLGLTPTLSLLFGPNF